MKRWIAWILVLTLLLGLAGCKRAEDEGSAASGEYIEGEEHQMSGDAPEKVTDWDVIGSSGTAPKPSQKPDDQKEDADEQPSDEQQGEQEPSDEQPEDEKPSKPVQKPQQKPQQKPGEEEDPDQPPVTTPGTPNEQPEELPEEDWEDPEEDLEEDYEEDEEDNEDDPNQNDGNDIVIKDPYADNTLKIVSYNVRCANDGDGKNIADRAPRFKKVMAQYDPDIMGLQEVVPSWMTHLERDFGSTYSYINQWRAASSQESTPIFWKKSKFTLVESGHFWLSDTPNKESKATSWGAEYYRICMWVKLKVKATGKTFLFFNTHFDTKSSPQVPSAKLVIERAEGMGGFSQFAVFCTGDFNMKPDTAGYKEMCKRFNDINRDLENLNTPTYTSYQTKAGSIIDYCFYSFSKVEPLKYQVVEEYVNNGYVSDHSGLYIEARLI